MNGNSSNYDFVEGIAKQVLNLFFIIDSSGSMSGERIGAVNNAIRDVMDIMPEIQEETADVEIKISALKFSDKASWIYPEAKSVEEFKWKDINADGVTNLTDAYQELEKQLTKESNGGMMPDFGGYAPIMILMTDGLPTSPDWPTALESLKKRGWFRVALRYALAIDIDSDEARDVLIAFTGNSETLLKVHSAESLRKVIKLIAVTASKVKSQSSTTLNNQAGAQNQAATKQINDSLADIDDVDGWN
ncbi:VWA domain-containing protein [Acholeplasma manati]|uniref:VWA domain-containing protein n=1 Tax=Paracholeplasma manati TaxID=591373 RepID=A0ABT2Y445_9MOLU|nr:VWA domain-containing protein [Paracholeplasma manati]MCV2231505.1 VWA domain-containing protein [Paracholeplasma manati]